MAIDSDVDIESFIDEMLDTLSSDAEKKVNREELEKELRKFLEYGVPLEHARQTLLKKFGGDTKTVTPVSSERVLIVDLQPGLPNVHLLCRVLNVNQREITARGEKRKIFYGILGDESGTMSFTAWKDFNLEKGTVVEIANAYTREWQSAVQINLGDRTVVEKTDEEKLPETSYVPKEYKVNELRAGLGSIEVISRILDVTVREVEVNQVKKSVFSGMIGDETGKAQFTSWHDFHLKTGDVVKISGGYVKTWKGVPQLTFDEKATVEKLDANLISKKDVTTQQLSLHDLVEKRGALDVLVEGTVIEIRDGSGVILRCPECKRVLQDSNCSTHGTVNGEIDFRVKLILDDGTGTVTSTIGRETTEQLLGKTLDEWKQIANQNEGNTLVIRELYSLLFGHRLTLQGNALGDQYGTTIIAKQVRFADFDIASESERLLHELEEFQ
ncbi:MAG: hypothetical protein V1726_05845 [Methanobacteriota archaeon]